MGDLRISELAARSGVPPTTLRYYEQVGLLRPGRAPNGYRSYDEGAESRLDFISAAKHLNLPLPKIRDLLDTWEQEPCHTVKAKLEPEVVTQIGETTRAIESLTSLRTTLQSTLARLSDLPDRDDRCDDACTDAMTEPSPPIACTLDSAGYTTRIEEWHSALADCTISEIPGGVRVQVPADRAGSLAALVVSEQHCCGFLGFDLAFHGDTTALTITTPEGAETTVRELLPTG